MVGVMEEMGEMGWWEVGEVDEWGTDASGPSWKLVLVLPAGLAGDLEGDGVGD